MARPTILAVLCCCFLSLVRGSTLPSKVTTKNCPSGSTSYNFNGTIITQIGKDFLAGSSPTCLDLQGNGITYIAQGAFEKLPKLTSLYLSRNGIQDIHRLLSFGPARMLQTIVFDEAQIGTRTNRPELELNQIYPELRELSLSGNRYTTVKHTGLINKVIFDVDVSKTKLAVPWNVFPKLQHADLSRNSFEMWSFPGLLPQGMLSLDVSRNMLTYFHGEYMPNLRTLLLQSNRIERIDSKILQRGTVLLFGLRELRQLSLSYNLLHSINCEAFKNVPQLDVLDLSANRLSAIQKGCFDSLSKLKSLNLTSNGLTKVLEVNATINLETLDLAFNKIKDLSASGFAKMPKLKTLNLSGNELRTVNEKSFFGLGQLEVLDLSLNMIRELPAAWITPLKKIHTLKLIGNEIVTLKSLPIGKTWSLRHLYLENNPLANLTADAFDHLPRALVIYINVNSVNRMYSNSL